MNLQEKISLEAIRNFLHENKAMIKKEFAIEKIGIFGSFITRKEKASSDIDIRIEFERDRTTFKNYMGLKFYLEDHFHRKVDLIIIENIKQLLKESILREAVYV